MKSHKSKSINRRTKKNSLARTRKTKHSNAKRISKKTHRGGAVFNPSRTVHRLIGNDLIITNSYIEYNKLLKKIFNIETFDDDVNVMIGIKRDANFLKKIIDVKDNVYYISNNPNIANSCFENFQNLKKTYVASQEIKQGLITNADKSIFTLFNNKISTTNLDELVFTNFISILDEIFKTNEYTWLNVYYKYKYDNAKKTIQYKDENPLNGIECLNLADKFLNSLYKEDSLIVIIDVKAKYAYTILTSIEQSEYKQIYDLIKVFIDVSIVCIILFNEFDNNPLNDDNTALQDQFDVLVNTYKVMDTQNNIKHNTLSEILTNKTENTDINIINNTNAEVEILMLFEKGPLNSILEFLYNKFSNKKINDYKLGKNVTHEFFLKTYSSFKQQYTSNGTDTKLPEDFTIQVAHQILNIL